MTLQPCQGGSCVVTAEDGIEGESLLGEVLCSGLAHAGAEMAMGFSTDLRIGCVETFHNACRN